MTTDVIKIETEIIKAFAEIHKKYNVNLLP